MITRFARIIIKFCEFDIKNKTPKKVSCFLVEVRGVEPLSESLSKPTSPSADGHLRSLTQKQAVTLLCLVADNS